MVGRWTAFLRLLKIEYNFCYDNQINECYFKFVNLDITQFYSQSYLFGIGKLQAFRRMTRVYQLK